MSALSAIYGRVAGFRRAWYERHPHRRRRLSRPVISVGNLVAGGSGKTPVVAALARLLIELHHRPAILSRGYGRRRSREPVVIVSDGEHVLVPVEESGDEPQMLARALPGVPVLVAADRHRAGQVAERRFGASVLLLDDGFQHLRLARSVDLLVVAPRDLDEPLLPSGLRREPLSAARAADAVLVPAAAGDGERVAAALTVERAFTIHLQHGRLRAIDGAAVVAGFGATAADPEQRRVVAVAGIARPERFFDALRQQGYDVVGAMPFRDHHWFTTADVARIEAAARASAAALIVTTHKDAVRLEPVLSRPGLPWALLPVSATIEPADAFATWLAHRIAMDPAAIARHARSAAARLE